VSVSEYRTAFFSFSPFFFAFCPTSKSGEDSSLLVVFLSSLSFEDLVRAVDTTYTESGCFMQWQPEPLGAAKGVMGPDPCSPSGLHGWGKLTLAGTARQRRPNEG
jgi:hypothetical protein